MTTQPLKAALKACRVTSSHTEVGEFKRAHMETKDYLIILNIGRRGSEGRQQGGEHGSHMNAWRQEFDVFDFCIPQSRVRARFNQQPIKDTFLVIWLKHFHRA